ncbi:hypothetical protein PPERSA_03675 [Pseudocohnilembus persalinus]|uniref:Uncharacterized protein n=1 Tax=Pseudocohnilembus persalinus TaxID=266149 RepID=A0A0V0QN67_PSEPJ|nr:hypothetical protein PPERSA_03675 [Pseudocohnilembus persalinus]|eukprot:KRX03714.1 hypothetical protein PPERSA_03675 [Pseudocohnilembus persalinus]
MEQEDKPHLRSLDKQLRDILIRDFPQFNDKHKLIPYYTKIENEQNKRKQIEFWDSVIKLVLREYKKSALFNLQEMYNIFTLDKFIPLGFKLVVKELTMIKDGHFTKREYFSKDDEYQIAEIIQKQKESIKKSGVKNLESSQKQENQKNNIQQQTQNQKDGFFYNILQKIKRFQVNLNFLNQFTTQNSDQINASNRDFILKNQPKKFSINPNYDANLVYFPLLEQYFGIFVQKTEELFQNKYQNICGENQFLKQLGKQKELQNISSKDLEYMIDLIVLDGQIERISLDEENVQAQTFFKTEDFVLIYNLQLNKSLDLEREQEKLIQKWKNEQIIRDLERKEKALNKIKNEQENKQEKLDLELKDLIAEGKRDKAKRQFPLLKIIKDRVNVLYDKIGVFNKMIGELKMHLHDSEAVDLMKVANKVLQDNKVNIEDLQNIQLDMQDRQADQEQSDKFWQDIGYNENNMNENDLKEFDDYYKQQSEENIQGIKKIKRRKEK